MSSELHDWKQEPLSPLIDESAWVSEETLYLTTLEHADLKFESEDFESKSELASKVLDDLDKLEDLDEWIKTEEPFQNWLDDKMIPMLEDVEAVHCIPIQQPIKPEKTKPHFVPDTRSLLMEFETVLDAVEMTHGTLTPPQSPPYEQQPLLTPLEPISLQPPAVYASQIPYPQNPVNIEFASIASPQTDFAQELDELVRTRAENMVQWEGPVSPGSSSNSNFGDCSSDDPEWSPEASSDQESSSAGPVKSSRKRSSKPYSRATPEDRKSRKKEQNKNAATRYRMKKKAQVEEILGEERGLLNEHDKLSENISDLNREIKYLKGLMRDLFKAKGLIH